MNDTPIKVISVPSITFEFGDKRFRSLYGLEGPKGERYLIGMIEEVCVERLEAMLEYADANMPKEDMK